MGFSRSFPEWLGHGEFQQANRQSGTLNNILMTPIKDWPAGVQIESLMSWMNDCAKYHRWNDTFNDDFKVTPEGFEFFLNGQPIIPEITETNLGEYKEKYSQLRNLPWSYIEFWQQLYSQLAYMYEKTYRWYDDYLKYLNSETPIDGIYLRKYRFLSDDDETHLSISGIVERYNSGIIPNVSGEITYDQVISGLKYGTPYHYNPLEIGSIYQPEYRQRDYFFPSGLNRYSKIPVHQYIPLLEHRGFHPIHWTSTVVIQRKYYNFTVNGDLYPVAEVTRDPWGPCLLESVDDCILPSVDNFNPFPIYTEKKINDRTFSNDKDHFFNVLLSGTVQHNVILLPGDIYPFQIPNADITKFKFQRIKFNSSYYNGSYERDSQGFAVLTRIDENGDHVVGRGILPSKFYPYNQFIQILHNTSGEFIGYGPNYIEGAVVNTRHPSTPPDLQAFIITPTLPEYLEKYGIKNVNYYPTIYNNKLCPKVNSTFNVEASLINEYMYFATYIGSGTFYNVYGPPVVNDTANAICEILSNNLDLEVRYGIGDPDPFNGEILYSSSQSGEHIINFEPAFTLKGEGKNLNLWFTFKDKNIKRFDEEIELFEQSIKDNIEEFFSELGFDPFKTDNDWANIFGYEPDDTFHTDNFIKPTRVGVFDFESGSWSLPNGETWNSPSQIYTKVWIPGDDNEMYYFQPNDIFPSIDVPETGINFDVEKFFVLSPLDESKFPFSLEKMPECIIGEMKFNQQSENGQDCLLVGGFKQYNSDDLSKFDNHNILKFPLTRFYAYSGQHYSNRYNDYVSWDW